jgi:PKHD-type hydroxylase
MFRLIPVLSAEQVTQLRAIAAGSSFVDGRISNPHSQVKNNLQLHELEPQKAVADIIRGALLASEEFREFTIPKAIAPPTLAKYAPKMYYGMHTDAALMPFPLGMIRADVSCTIFLNDPDSYEGGALRVTMGAVELAFKEPPGIAIVYPSTTLHAVEPVTRGERLVGLTFIQSRIADPAKREMLFDLGDVAGREGFNMAPENYARLRGIQANLTRRWTDAP